MSENKSGEQEVKSRNSERQTGNRWRFDMLVVGLILIGLGAVLIVATLDPRINLRDLILTYWPLLLVAAGIIKILQALTGIRGGGSGLAILITVVIILVIAAGLPWEWIRVDLGGYDWFPPDHMYNETISLREGQSLEVRAYECRVIVYGHSDEGVVLRVKTYVSGWWDRKRAKEIAEDFKASVDRGDSSVQIVCDAREFGGNRYRGRVILELAVPDDIVARLFGERSRISVEDVRADMRINSREGRIDLERSEGKFSINIRSADVDLENLDAEVLVEGDHTEVDMDEIYGAITVKLERGYLDLHNGSRVSGDMDIGIESGRIELDLNELSEIAVSATTETGRISCDFLDFDESGLRDLNRSFNGGTYRVILSSKSGSISIDSN